MYDWLKFLHVVAAITWVGGAFWSGFFGMRVAAAKDPARAKAFAQDMLVGSRLIIGSATLVLVFGVWMVLTEDVWEWEQLFIVVGIATVVIGGALGGAFFTPQTQAAVADFEAGNIPGAIARMQRIGQVSRLMLLLLLVTVFSMVAKWGV